jgi:hypothetical protein
VDQTAAGLPTVSGERGAGDQPDGTRNTGRTNHTAGRTVTTGNAAVGVVESRADLRCETGRTRRWRAGRSEEMSSESRVIDGMVIARHPLRTGGFLWQSIEQKPPIESQSYDDKTGQMLTRIEYFDPRVIWSGSNDPEATRARYGHVRFRDFNPYDPDPEHDEYEKLLEVSTYFAAKFAAQFKIKPRQPIGTLSLGSIRISFNCHKAGCPDERVRELLREHANGNWGEHGCLADYPDLVEDEKWCPVLYGVGMVNAVSIATGAGIVQSAYPARGFNGQHREHIDFITFLDSHNETLIVSRRHDS